MDRERNSHLGLVLGETQRRLLLTLHAPADQPALEQALGGAALAVLALGRWITEPDFYLRELCAALTLRRCCGGASPSTQRGAWY